MKNNDINNYVGLNFFYGLSLFLFVLISLNVSGQMKLNNQFTGDQDKNPLAKKEELLKIDTTLSIEYMVDKILVGNGIRVGNIKLNGLKVGIGYFQIDTNVIGMKSGVVLSTGLVSEIAQPNHSPGNSGLVSDYTKKYKSDKDLNRL